jgi:hypothetical protein
MCARPWTRPEPHLSEITRICPYLLVSTFVQLTVNSISLPPDLPGGGGGRNLANSIRWPA